MKYMILSYFLLLSISYSQCDDLLETQCNSNTDCEWIEDINSGWCGSLDNNYSECNNIDECTWSTCQVACSGTGYSDCVSQPGCSYSWLEYSCTGYYSAPCCEGVSYLENNPTI